ncbi:UNVERIFIED_CONTAM: hypothetical protein K2H54_048040 [Gekko kuhli]
MAGAHHLSIKDILSKPSGCKATSAHLLDKGVTSSSGSSRSGAPALASLLCTLKELATKTFKGLEVNVQQAAEGLDDLAGELALFHSPV